MEKDVTANALEPMTFKRALFSFEGRMRRRDYWLKCWLVLFPFGILNNILYVYALAEENKEALILSTLIGFLALWPSLAGIVKRLHDHNHSGWFLATLLIPFANIVFALVILVEVMFLRGTVGPNRFGFDPVGSDQSAKELISIDQRGWLNTISPVLALLAVFGLFVLIAPSSFATFRNLETIARQTTIVGIAALGMTLVIISGGIDLSVGSIVALSTVVIAWLLQYAGAGPLTAAIGGVAAAAFFGLLSGVLITRLRVVPFIVTLGMMLVVRGAAKGIGREQKIDVDPQQLKWLDELLASLPAERSWMLLPPGVWMMIFLAIAMAALLRYTRLGRHTFAIGSNEQTARLCGVAVERVKVLVYTLCGAFGGLAGLMQFSRLTVGDPTVAVGLELNVIAAVVIGGGSLAGGEGSILGTLVGALIMTVIASGCTQRGYPNWVQEIITGAIIVIAVALDRLRHRRTT